jgi:hypothetical protein
LALFADKLFAWNALETPLLSQDLAGAVIALVLAGLLVGPEGI